jgi:hypothetical protein
VVIVCAGGMEDSAFAGMLVDFLQNTLGPTAFVLAESAKEAVALYKPWQGRLLDLLKESLDGKELIKKGLAKDLDFASKLNKISSVPYLKDDVFLKEDTPKRKLLEEKKPTAPQKGKSIKITAPLFPKNPEHPVPGMEKSAKKDAHLSEDKKKDEKKHGDKKSEKTAAPPPVKKVDGKSSLVKPKKVHVPKPMFSKKTVATAAVVVKKLK